MKFCDKFDVIENNQIVLKIIGKFIGNYDELPFYYYNIFLKSSDIQIGKISIRIGHNKHSYYNGNIGYEINEAHRGYKYSLQATKLVIAIARYHKMAYINITCDASNSASQKIIESLGAKFIETVTPPKDYIFYYEDIEPHRIYQLDL